MEKVIEKNEPNGDLKSLISEKQKTSVDFQGKDTNKMDKETFSSKVLEAEDTLYRVAKTILLCDSDCDDAVSEAVTAAYIKLDTLREERYFKTWLVRILMNVCYKKCRERKRIVPYDEYITSDIPDDRPDYSELYGAIRELKEKFRMVIVLYYIEDYSVEEIGNLLHIPSGTVKSRLSKGRKQLKNKLKETEI